MVETDHLPAAADPDAGLDVTTLRRRIPELTEVLVAAAESGIPEGVPDWQLPVLTARVRRVVPLVLPAALSKLESGGLLSEREIEPVRASGAQLAALDVPLPVALATVRPALATFNDVITNGALPISVDVQPVLLARAAQLANQIVVEKAVGWSGSRETAPSAEAMEPQDQEMLAMLAHGYSTEQIARATAYSSQAVRWRLGRLMRRWRVPNRVALVTTAFHRGVLKVAAQRPVGGGNPIGPPPPIGQASPSTVPEQGASEMPRSL